MEIIIHIGVKNTTVSLIHPFTYLDMNTLSDFQNYAITRRVLHGIQNLSTDHW